MDRDSNVLLVMVFLVAVMGFLFLFFGPWANRQVVTSPTPQVTVQTPTAPTIPVPR